MENKSIKFKHNKGLRNKYCLVIGPNGAGKTTLLKKMNREIKNSLYINDGDKKTFFPTDTVNTNINSMKVIKSTLSEYGIIPDFLNIRVRSLKSFYDDYFDYDSYLELVEFHSKYFSSETISKNIRTKTFIKTVMPIFTWYVINKFKEEKPTKDNNIFVEFKMMDEILMTGIRGRYFYRGDEIVLIRYIISKVNNDFTRDALEFYLDFISKFDGRRVPKQKIVFEEALKDSNISFLTGEGLLVAVNSNGFSAGQRRLFEMLMKASSKGLGGKTIIIDEIELNLHPTWLKEVVKIFDDVFSNTNFLISSHSPILISGFESKNIISLNANGERWRVKEGNFGKNASWIMREVMGMDYTYASHADEYMNKEIDRILKKMKEF